MTQLFFFLKNDLSSMSMCDFMQEMKVLISCVKKKATFASLNRQAQKR